MRNGDDLRIQALSESGRLRLVGCVDTYRQNAFAARTVAHYLPPAMAAEINAQADADFARADEIRRVLEETWNEYYPYDMRDLR